MANVTTLLKYGLKTNIVKAILFDVLTNTSRYYYAFGKTDEWPLIIGEENGIPIVISDESVPPSVIDSYNYELEVRKNAAFIKLVDVNDVAIVINRIQWTQGFVYDMYDEYSSTNPSFTGATSLDQASFYVLNSRFEVFKCLFNNGNRPSSVEPTMNPTDVTSPIVLNDGYIWKYMYNIPLSLRNKFLSEEYMPVNTALTSSFYSNGAISGFTITNPGKDVPQFRKIKSFNINTAGVNYGTVTFNFPSQSFEINGTRKTSATVTVDSSNGAVTDISYTNGLYYLSDPVPTLTYTNLGLDAVASTWVATATTIVVTKPSSFTVPINTSVYLEFTSVNAGEIPASGTYVVTDVNAETLTFSHDGSLNGKSGSSYIIPLGAWESLGENGTEITFTGHGLGVNSVVELEFLTTSSGGSSPENAKYTISSVTDSNTFTIAAESSESGTLIIRKIASGFTYSLEYEEDLDSGFNEIELEGDGRSLFNGYSIKEVSIQNRGLFKTAISGSPFTFPNPPVLNYGNIFAEVPRKPSLNPIYRPKQIREATWSFDPAYPDIITVNKTLHDYVNGTQINLYFDTVNVGTTKPNNAKYTIDLVNQNVFEIPITGALNGNVDISLGSATWEAESTTPTIVTITKANHGITNGTTLYFTFAGLSTKPADNSYVIAVEDANTFTITVPSLTFGENTTLSGSTVISVTGATWQSTPESSAVTITKVDHGLADGSDVSLIFTTGVFRPNNTNYTITRLSNDAFNVTSSLSLIRSGTLSVDYIEVNWAITTSPTTLTIEKSNHGYSVNDKLYLEFTTVNTGAIKPDDNIYTVVTATTNSFTVATNISQNISGKAKIDLRAAEWTYTAGQQYINIYNKNHGLSNSDVITLVFQNSNLFDSKTYTVIYIDTNNFRVTVPSLSISSSGVLRFDNNVFLELDRIEVDDPGYGYDKPFRVSAVASTDTSVYTITSVLLTSTVNTVEIPSFTFDESSQRNEGFVRGIISPIDEGGKGRVLENIVISDPGIGYTTLKATFNSYIKVGGAPVLATLADEFNVALKEYVSPTLVLGISQGNTDSNQSDVEIQAKDGSIEVILVENSGTGYTELNKLVVVGDGNGCEAELIIENGQIVGVTVTNSGEKYTNASFIITGDNKPDTVGDGVLNPTKARLRAVISPKGGHGKDAIQELFARTIAFYTKIVGNETNQGLTPDTDYRQVSILKNPLSFGLNEYYKNSTGSGCILVIADKTVVNNAAYSVLDEGISLNITTNPNQANQKQFKFVFVDKEEIDEVGGNSYYAVLLNPVDGKYIPSQGENFKFTVGSTNYVLSANRIITPSYDKLSGELLYINNRLAFNPSPEQAVTITTLISF